MRSLQTASIRAILLIALTGFLVSLSGALFGLKAQETITLKVADQFPPGHYGAENGNKWWMERVTELTDGQVQFDYYPANQLGKTKDFLSLTQRGVADIAFIAPNFNSGKMPLSTVHSLPGLVSSPRTAVWAFWDTIHNTGIMENDYLKNGLRPMWGYMTPTYNLFTSTKPVKTLSDMKGMKIRSGGGYQNATIDALGATPVHIPGDEMYTAMQQGTVDGTILSTISLFPYNFNEVVDYYTQGFDMSIFFVPYLINENKWQSFPQNVRNAFTQANYEVMQKMALYLEQREEELLQKIKDDGIEVFTLPEQDQQKVTELLSTVQQEWVEEMSGKGHNAQQILDYFKQSVKRQRQIYKQ